MNAQIECQEPIGSFEVVVLDIDGAIARQHRLIEKYRPIILRPSDNNEAKYYK